MPTPAFTLAGGAPASIPALIKSSDFDSDIGALSSQILWLVSDKFRLTLAGLRASSWADRSKLAGSVTQNGTGRQPQFVQSAFNGMGGLRFGYGRGDGFTCPQTVSTTGDFSFVTVIAPSDQTGDAQRLIYIGGTTGSYAVLQVTGDGRIQLRVGDGTTFASAATVPGLVSTAIDPTTTFFVVAGYNYATKTAWISINGGAPIIDTKAGVPDLASGAIRIGYDANNAFPFNGMVGDIDILSTYLPNPGEAAAMDAFKRYGRSRYYGLNIA